jgi:hypothetical protein
MRARKPIHYADYGEKGWTDAAYTWWRPAVCGTVGYFVYRSKMKAKPGDTPIRRISSKLANVTCPECWVVLADRAERALRMTTLNRRKILQDVQARQATYALRRMVKGA